MRTFNKQTKAFTMMELVFVIVVLGILAAIALPRMDRDLRQEAKDHLLSAIRHTQQLALIDDQTDPSDANWQAKLWNISFPSDGSYYTISANSVAAIDPLNGKLIDGTATTASPNVFIGKKYSINNVNVSGGCTGRIIAFDNFGRPFKSISGTNDYGEYMTSDCIMTMTFEQNGITPLNITIATETGYVSGD